MAWLLFALVHKRCENSDENTEPKYEGDFLFG